MFEQIHHRDLPHMTNVQSRIDFWPAGPITFFHVERPSPYKEFHLTQDKQSESRVNADRQTASELIARESTQTSLKIQHCLCVLFSLQNIYQVSRLMRWHKGKSTVLNWRGMFKHYSLVWPSTKESKRVCLANFAICPGGISGVGTRSWKLGSIRSH